MYVLDMRLKKTGVFKSANYDMAINIIKYVIILI